MRSVCLSRSLGHVCGLLGFQLGMIPIVMAREAVIDASNIFLPREADRSAGRTALRITIIDDTPRPRANHTMIAIASCHVSIPSSMTFDLTPHHIQHRFQSLIEFRPQPLPY